MNRRAMQAIIQKDIMVITRSRGVFLPLILVPSILLIAVPIIVVVSLGPEFYSRE